MLDHQQTNGLKPVSTELKLHRKSSTNETIKDQSFNFSKLYFKINASYSS